MMKKTCPFVARTLAEMPSDFEQVRLLSANTLDDAEKTG
jgi:hypothetical protein